MGLKIFFPLQNLSVDTTKVNKIAEVVSPEALKQIKENAYAAKYKTDGKKIVLIGAGFEEATRTIKNWKVEQL